jgi:hypothetical protein
MIAKNQFIKHQIKACNILYTNHDHTTQKHILVLISTYQHKTRSKSKVQTFLWCLLPKSELESLA